MITLFQLNDLLIHYLQDVKTMFNEKFTLLENSGWVYVDTHTTFLTPAVLGLLPVRLLPYLSLDSTSCTIKLMFDKSEFQS